MYIRKSGKSHIFQKIKQIKLSGGVTCDTHVYTRCFQSVRRVLSEQILAIVT